MLNPPTPDLLMRRAHCFLPLLLLVTGTAEVGAQPSSTRPKSAEPVVASASSEAEDAIAAFKKPSGWTVDVAAAEPEVANIVAFDIDDQGRLWVCETFRQDNGVTDNRAHDDRWLRADLAAMSVADRAAYHKRLLGDGVNTYSQQVDRIRRIEDTDDDGSYDRSTIFASGFNDIEEGTGAGVLAIGDDVYYTCIPRLWKFTDSDGDGRADREQPLADGFGIRVAFRGHDMHGLIRGPDGRLYFSIGDRGYNVKTSEGKHLFDPASGAVFRCELDGSNLEVYATGLRNPQELAFDEFGDLFTGDNNSDSGDKARWVYVVEGGDTGWRMYYQYLPDRGPFNREKIWHPFHDEQPAYIVPPIANISDGPSGLAYYPGTGLGKNWRGRFLLADFRGSPAKSGIRTFRSKPKGAFYELIDDEQPIWSILATDVAFGPDGGVYVSDWVDGWVGEGKGRIYRFADPKFSRSDLVQEVKSLLASDWTTHPTDELTRLLGHADQRVRLRAQWQLADRGARSELIATMEDRSLKIVSRLHGVWGIGQCARTAPLEDEEITAIEAMLADEDPYLRRAAIELLGEIGAESARPRVRKSLRDQDARVQYAAVIALGKLRDNEAFKTIVRLLDDNDNEDPIIRHGGIMALTQIADDSTLAALSQHVSGAVRRAAVVALRRQGSARIAEFLSDRDPLVAVEAARAIYDVPIDGAMPALADLIEDPTDQDALTRRVLAANFRLGGDQRLREVAKFAADTQQAESLRLEALELLSHWREPDAIDRLLHQWRRLKHRPDAAVAGVVRKQLTRLLGDSDAIVNRTIQLAAQLEIAEIAPYLIDRLGDQSVDIETRSESLRALARLDPVSATGSANQAISAKEPELKIAAIDVLSQLDAGNLLTVLREATESEYPALRQRAWDLIGGMETPEAIRVVEDGLQQYIDGELPADVWLNVLEAAKGKTSDSLERDLREAQTRWQESDPLAEYRVALEGGNPSTGEKLFFEKTALSCSRCHRVHRRGGQVGPVLTTIGAQRDRKYLLEAIVKPDTTIAKGFETAVIADDFGEVYTGIIRSENETSVRMTRADGSEVMILQEEIIARKRGKSAMPEDLIKQMNHREIRDLVAYLESLKIDPRAVDQEQVE